MTPLLNIQTNNLSELEIIEIAIAKHKFNLLIK